MTVVILNGPNLNRLGTRKPEIYGTLSMAQILLDIQRQLPDVHFVYKQSNHEGDLIDWIQSINDGMSAASLLNDDASLNDVCGIILNAGGYSHTSVAIHDALKAVPAPAIEVHISNIFAREEYRHHSLLSSACRGIICGLGLKGYQLAIEALTKD